MFVGSVMVFLISVMLASPSARADGGASGDADLTACKGLPAHGKAEPINEDVSYLAAGQYVAFPRMEGGGCEVYSLARPTAQIRGRFAGGTLAVAVKPSRCSAESCPIVVAVRGKHAKPLAVVRTDVDCDQGIELKPIQLVVGHDDLDLVCRISAGAGWNERHLLIDVSQSVLTPFYLAETGSYIALSPAEKKVGGKPSCPVGSLRVEQIGDEKVQTKPLLRWVDPSAGKLHNGRGTLSARQLAVDLAHHDVKPTGAPDVPTEVDAHRGCR
jgi:hypothetical protein